MSAVAQALRDEADALELAVSVGDTNEVEKSVVLQALRGVAHRLDTPEARAGRQRSIDFLMSVRESMRKEHWVMATEDMLVPLMYACGATRADLDEAKRLADERHGVKPRVAAEDPDLIDGPDTVEAIPALGRDEVARWFAEADGAYMELGRKLADWYYANGGEDA